MFTQPGKLFTGAFPAWLAAFLIIASTTGWITWKIFLSPSPPPNTEALLPASPLPGPETSPIKMLEGRKSLIGALSRESVFDSINNLPNYDDQGWVIGTMGNDIAILSYRRTRKYIPRLHRVRKILEQGRDEPEAVIAVLKQKLSRSAQGFNEVRTLSRKLTTGTMSAPDDFDRCTTDAPAATYLLAEFGAREALPLMAKIYLEPGSCPVSRPFLFYAMHLLVRDHPRERLSPAACEFLDRYLQETKGLPEPESVAFCSWHADFDETDFRHALLQQDVGLHQQPKIALRLYPEALDKFDDLGGPPQEEINRLFSLLYIFVDLAYLRKTEPERE